VTLLDITVDTGEFGPVVSLSGECDLSTAGQLSAALTAQISGGAQHLTVDLSRLTFADSVSIRVLIQAHYALQDRGGVLELAYPHASVARSLSLLAVDQILTVRTKAPSGPQPTIQ
jgi:anti-sigma B factor antagonist